MWETNIIFDWIIISSSAAIVIICIILFAKLIFKNKQSANWHYYIWFILVIKLLIPYSPVSSISIFNNIPSEIKALSFNQSNLLSFTKEQTVTREKNMEVSNKLLFEKENINGDTSVQLKDNQFESFQNKFNLKFKLMVIWLTGVFIFGGYVIFINLRFLLRIRKCLRIDNNSINKIFNECKLTLGINRDIHIISTCETSIPSLWGIVRPKLLIPNNMIKKISNDELKHIFFHELSHFKRKDNLVNWIIILLKILHWFNPIVWYGFYKMHQDCEISCDAVAMSHMSHEEQKGYGYTILHLIKITSTQKWIPGTIGILSNKSEMKRRITMISLFNKKSFKCSAVGVGILIALSGVLLTNSKDYTSKIIRNEVKADTAQSRSSETSVDLKSSVNVMDIKGNNFKGKIINVPNPKKIEIGYSLKDSKPYKTTSEIAKDKNAVAAINGGRFKDDSTVLGFILKNGNLVYNELKDENTKQNVAGFTDEGKLIVGSYTLTELKKMAVKDAITSYGPALIINGKPTKDSNMSLGINARMAIGQKADGTVIMLAIDGRSKESFGAQIKDVTNILCKNNVINATLLDGGSSSTMYFNGDIINHPCYEKAKERAVPSAFLVLP